MFYLYLKDFKTAIYKHKYPIDIQQPIGRKQLDDWNTCMEFPSK